MTGRLRVIETGLASGRWNTALSAALLRAGADPSADACVRFYRFEPCVLLGLSQPYATAAVLAGGIEIARRITGGGNVYMSPTMLAWDVVLRQTAPVDDMSLMIGSALASALACLGYANVTASATGLMLGGRKVSGVAMTSDRGAFLYQGTLLIDDETPAMAAALGVPRASLAAHVTCLRDASVDLPEPAQLQAALATHLAARFGCVASPGRLTAQEQAMAAREHTREVGGEAYVRGVEADEARRARA